MVEIGDNFVSLDKISCADKAVNDFRAGTLLILVEQPILYVQIRVRLTSQMVGIKSIRVRIRQGWTQKL